jgi:predicted ATPase
MREDPFAAAAEARALELRARKHAEGAFERCDNLVQTDGELLTKSREMIDLARRRLRQVPKLEQFTP